ncbi:hypothetical protein QDX92_003952 [Salmonella enterica]|uniref:Uncharacterized protein n=1 Tax=Salmonella enterica subsp. enterica serovar Gaminara TaxID=913070 RepID=A0A602MPA7_SALET|nr:hypothetical protein [Salmonella enterica]EAA2780102.1 hypothetical protein [Salmonella enterica subsp. enterica serovar Montevideo]EBY7362857.1 hypothetical protein [Salmonella enterica subsp. enterica serovar Tennessee]ECE7084930.1 hypothetical protein [Salmonella enterica subsp. enterica]ECG1246042.1 hypothetical protein [Salmonella enterica subsp. houtenae]ECJ8298097.1 hypothetical protein [Salmonella enterica subsp. enterica serovar Virchow]ECO1513945.1 hypothetical protein [Salmonell
MSAEIKPAQDYRAVLMAGGMPKECADRLVAYLDDEKPVENDIEKLLVSDLKIQMAEALSLSWIIRELRKIATGEDKQAAVAALQILRELSFRLLKAEPVFNEFG